MAAKIVSALITFVLLLALAVVIFAFMIIVMNGFSESDAAWGIWAFIILTILITILMTAGAALTAHRLGKRDMHVALIIFLTAAIFSTVGATLIAISGFVGVMVAEFVRVNF